MTNTLTISREHAQRLIKGDASKGANALQLIDAWKAMEELRAILAAPAVERQEPVALGFLYRDKNDRIIFEPNGDPHIRDYMQVFDSPPAPVAVQDESIIRDAERYRFVRNGTAEANYICLSSVQGDMDAAIDACLDKVKEMNP